MRQLAYSSIATRLPDTADLVALLTVSRGRNHEAGITGLLICHGTNFMQCLEGSPEAIAATMERIRRDPRHRAIEVLLDRPVTRCSFAAWDMACTDVTASWWLDLATADWVHNRQAAHGRTVNSGFALMEQAWTEAQGQTEKLDR